MAPAANPRPALVLSVTERGADTSSKSSIMARRSALPISCPPRLLPLPAAAEYVSVSPSKFAELVRKGLMPQPKRIDRRVAWDRIALDRAIDALPGGDAIDDESWADIDAA